MTWLNGEASLNGYQYDSGLSLLTLGSLHNFEEYIRAITSTFEDDAARVSGRATKSQNKISSHEIIQINRHSNSSHFEKKRIHKRRMERT